ncbi:apolipoprotein N-acyltransferase [Azospirillum agricola]|uniref:apolipoprotein N-acyltransferase n=1 Tax=Azospirillum agricola TaxID=1720247 RepID=UPI000A0F0973|nr:apolipoprotein N-acyltransferase [Azospirillum agricola]SMH61454.1 Apolipoprotein N-acyltransferase [Azospirillum lipoferum]
MVTPGRRRLAGGLWRCVAAALLGGLAVAALPPLSIPPVLALAFGGLFLLLDGAPPVRAALVGWSFGFGFFVVGTHWIAESFLVEPERFGWLAAPAVTGIGAILAVFSAVPAWAVARLKVGGLPGALLFASLWAGAEWLRGHVLTGFPWNLVAYGWVELAGPRQAAAVVGSYGLSLLTVLAMTVPAVLLRCRSRRERRRTVLVGGAVALVLASGALRLTEPPLPAPAGPLVRIVQGNIPQASKWRPERRAATVERYLDLSSQAGRFDLLVWPETAYPGFLEESAATLDRIAALLPRGGHLLAGTPRRSQEATGPAYWNAIVAIDDRGRVTATYAKHHLVPFGEYVPLRGLLPIERIAPGLGDFSAGPGPRTLRLGGTAVGAAICYEVIFPGAVVERVNRPDWIVNATNDAWFGTSMGPYQHLASARMRAVEEGLPVVRAANTGISAVIDGFGRLRASLPLEQTGIIDAPLPPPLPPTLYGRYGDWTFLGLLLAVLSLAWILRRDTPPTP